MIKNLVKGLIDRISSKCSVCGEKGSYTVSGLCNGCWYARFGSGKNIWEIQDELEKQEPNFFSFPLKKIKGKYGD